MRGIRTAVAAAFAAFGLAGSAMAQPVPPWPSQPEQGTMLNVPTPKPTKFQPLDRSLEELLNDGYTIHVGGTGVIFLEKAATDKIRWIVCGFDLSAGLADGVPGSYRQPSFPCYALN